jgi:mgtE-like transporter
MLYLGELEPSVRDKKVLENVVIAMLLSLIPVSLLWAVSVIRGVRYHAIEIFFIVIGSTILVSLILGYFTAGITIAAFRHDVDPDSLAAPLVASMGDLLTIPTLIAFIILLESNSKAFWSLNGLSVVLLLILWGASRVGLSKFGEYRELFMTITALAMLSLISGFTLERFSGLIASTLVLGFAYPSILSSFGNYGSIIAAKTSTKLNLGEIDRYLSRDPFEEILALLLTAPIVGVLINLLSAGIAYVLLGTHPMLALSSLLRTR